MPSNLTLNAGSGGGTLTTKQRTHDGDTTQCQSITVAGVTGTEDAYTFVDVTAGGGAEATALLVTIANDSTGLLSVDDNGGSLTVDWNGTAPPIGAGLEATALRVTLATDSTGVVSIDDNSGSITVDNGGTFAVQVDGAALTALQLIDDAVYTDATGTPSKGLAVMGTDGTNPQLVSVNTSGHVNIADGGNAITVDGTVTVVNGDITAIANAYMADDTAFTLTSDFVCVSGAIRDDALGTLTAVEGDAVPLRVDSTGALWVNVTDTSFTVTASALDIRALTNADVVTAELSATDNAVLDQIEVNTSYGDNTGNGTAAGALRVTVASDSTGTIAATQSGTWNVTNISGTVSLPTGAATAANQATHTTALQLIDNMIVAHDAAITGATGLAAIGLNARSTSATAVQDGDAVRALATLLGKQVNLPYAIPANTWNYAAASGGITNTTGVTARAAQAAGIRNYVTRCQVINGHASVSTDVQIRDGASGTVLWRGFAQAGGGGVTAVFDPPLRGTAATLVEIACGTTGSATYFNLQGYSAAE